MVLLPDINNSVEKNEKEQSTTIKLMHIKLKEYRMRASERILIAGNPLPNN